MGGEPRIDLGGLPPQVAGGKNGINLGDHLDHVRGPRRRRIGELGVAFDVLELGAAVKAGLASSVHDAARQQGAQARGVLVTAWEGATAAEAAILGLHGRAL